MKIFSGSNSSVLARSIVTCLLDRYEDKDFKELANLKIKKFSDGEISPEFLESLRDQRIYIIQSTNSPGDNIVELMLILDAARRACAKEIIAVIPYFAYARQDRKDSHRTAIGAKVMMDVFQSCGANRILTIDLHAAQIEGFCNMPIDHIHGFAIFKRTILSLNEQSIKEGRQLVLCSPDVGGVKRVSKAAKIAENRIVVLNKQRKVANEVESMDLIGDVTNADVLIIDDMVDTAGTLAKAADKLLEAGAHKVSAMVTHAVLSGNGKQNIENSKLEKLYVTDTISHVDLPNKIEVVSSAHVLARAIWKIHHSASLEVITNV